MPPIHPPILNEAPFVRLLPPLLAGIALGWLFPIFPVFYPLWAAGIFIIFLLALFFVLRLLGGPLRKYSSGGLLFALLLFGYLLSCWNRDNLRPDFANHFLSENAIIRIKLISPLTEKAHTWKAEAALISIINHEKTQKVRGKAFLYFQKGAHKPPLRYGDQLLIPNRLEPVKNSKNPGAFNYQRYCHLKNIFYTAYLPTGQWKVLKGAREGSLKSLFLQWRKACLSVLVQYIKPSRESGVAEALLLGYRADLDPELYQAYAHVGVVHLIAISGLHIGLIYLVLLWLLRFLPHKKPFRTAKGMLICICLWGFTLLTGAHPSTLRATIMLSFLVVGKYLFVREANTYNSLAASAFLLLCINPFLLFDVGFQLSYLAVTGILIFQKPVHNLFWFKYKVPAYIWELLSVSLAAQLLTFPLVLYYFHQFPTFFLLSNLLLIPAATLALYGEIALLVFSFLPGLANILGHGISKLLMFMNGSILWADQFHFIQLRDIRLPLAEVFLVYGFIICMAVWLLHQSRRALVAALGVVMIAGIFSLIREWNILNQRKLIVYQIKGHSAVEWIRGRNSHLLGDSMVLHDPDILQYTLRPSMEKLNLKNRSVLSKNLLFLNFQDKRIGIIQKKFPLDALKGFMALDYLIISRHNHLKMKNLKKHFSPEMIVFDASVAPWQKQKWKTDCKKLNLHFYSVSDQGAWIVSFKK